MIGTLADDLVTKIKAIPSFGNTKVGLTLGSKTSDPILDKIAKPACWVLFVSDTNVNERASSCLKQFNYQFVVQIVMEYTNDKNMIEVQYPLLEEVINAIHGKGYSNGSDEWRYNGQIMEQLTDKRVIFQQTYSVTATL